MNCASKYFRLGCRTKTLLAAALSVAFTACAQTRGMPESTAYFLSAQDGRAGLVDGKPAVRNANDTLAVIELAGGHLRVVEQIEVPTSLVGPPGSIAIAPNHRLALVSAATRRDPVNETKVVPYDLVSVVSLDPSGGTSPRVIASLHTGAGGIRSLHQSCRHARPRRQSG